MQDTKNNNPAFNSHRCHEIVILGAPESGKTTFREYWQKNSAEHVESTCTQNKSISTKPVVDNNPVACCLFFWFPRNFFLTLFSQFYEINTVTQYENMESKITDPNVIVILVCSTHQEAIKFFPFLSRLVSISPSQACPKSTYVIINMHNTSSCMINVSEVEQWTKELPNCVGCFQLPLKSSVLPLDRQIYLNIMEQINAMSYSNVSKSTQGRSRSGHGTSKKPPPIASIFVDPSNSTQVTQQGHSSPRGNAHQTWNTPTVPTLNRSMTSKFELSRTSNQETAPKPEQKTAPIITKTPSTTIAPTTTVEPLRKSWNSVYKPSQATSFNSNSSLSPSNSTSQNTTSQAYSTKVTHHTKSASNSSDGYSKPLLKAHSAKFQTLSSKRTGESNDLSPSHSKTKSGANHPPKLITDVLLPELQPKQFQSLPLINLLTLTLRGESQWFRKPIRMRISNTKSSCVFAFYNADEPNEGSLLFAIQTHPFEIYSTSSSEQKEDLANQKFHTQSSITTFSDPSYPYFFWIREQYGADFLVSSSDSTTMCNYLRKTFPGMALNNMKSHLYMSIFLQRWMELCTDGIPPEPKKQIDLACTSPLPDQSYVLEFLALEQTDPEKIIPIVQCLHWYPLCTVLEFNGCGITDEVGSEILWWITQNSYIRSVSLADNKLGAGSVPTIQALLSRSSKRLFSLNLDRNSFSPKAAASIIEALSMNSSVKQFSMTGIPTNKLVAASITHLFEKNYTLQSLKLDLSQSSEKNERIDYLAETLLISFFSNTSITKMDLNIPHGSDIKHNIDKLIERNGRGVSSSTLAGWVSDWPKLLDIKPIKSEHYDQMVRATSKQGMYWKGVTTYTGTMEPSDVGKLIVSSDGIIFQPSQQLSKAYSIAGSIQAVSMALIQGSSANNSANTRSFSWTPTLRIGQLTSSPVIIVIYDPSQYPDPLVCSMHTNDHVLQAIICLNALEGCETRGNSEKPSVRGRSRAVGPAEAPTIENFLDFSAVVIGEPISPAGASGTEIRKAIIDQKFTCCVKILDCSQYGSDEVESMEREISLLIMSKKCNQIVRYLHHEKVGNHLRLFMELFPMSLKKAICMRKENNNFFTQQQVYDLARKILKGLRFLHTQPQPIVHRDIKSDNLLVEEDIWGNLVRVKLADFGSAKILTKGRTGSIDHGTSGYQAPEMVRNQDSNDSVLSYTTAVDIFSFGITLYEILALQKVYLHCQTRQELEEALKNAEKFPPDYHCVPRHLFHFLLIVSPCLRRNYTERPTASELLSQLEVVGRELKLNL